MLIHLAFHRHPKPGKEDELAASMKHFGQVMSGCKGLRQVFTLKDPQSGALVGLALWDSPEDLSAARPLLAEAIKDVDFSQLENSDPEVYFLEALAGAGEIYSKT